MMHQNIWSKIPMLCQWSTILNGKNRPKGCIYRSNNSHITTIWSFYMPENVLLDRGLYYGQSVSKLVLQPFSLQNWCTPRRCTVTSRHRRNLFQQIESWRERFFDIRGGPGSPKAVNWNQSPGKPEGHFGHKYICGSRKENKNNKRGSATRKRKPLSQDIHGHAWGDLSI